LTELTTDAIIDLTVSRNSQMTAEYKIGQTVVITPTGEESLSTRDSDVRQYAGRSGEITDLYWIQPPTGEIFYLYTVRIGTGDKDIVLYEDEIKPLTSAKPGRRNLKAQ